MSKASFIIWHDNDLDLAHWIKENTKLSSYRNVAFRLLFPPTNKTNFPKMPREIQKLLYLDKHDIIITIDEGGAPLPVITLEFMTHTPQSQHTKQRFCRIVAAAENRVPCAFIIPEMKVSGGQSYRCTPDIFYALHKLMDIHRIPSFGYFWPHDNGVLKNSQVHPSAPREEGQIKYLFEFVDLCIEYAVQGRPPTLLFREPLLFSHIDFTRTKAYESPVEISRYTGLSLVSTSGLAKRIRREYNVARSSLPDYFLGRSKSLIQSHEFIATTSQEHFRTDPYAGMQAFFDYCFCRVGETTMHRRYNLVFEARGVALDVYTNMYHSYWKQSCPFNKSDIPDNIPLLNLHIKSGCTYTKNKQLRTYGYLSDMLIFDDFVIFG
jgi:hypothetical protein